MVDLMAASQSHKNDMIQLVFYENLLQRLFTKVRAVEPQGH